MDRSACSGSAFANIQGDFVPEFRGVVASTGVDHFSFEGQALP
jgi:hypothetical protein